MRLTHLDCSCGVGLVPWSMPSSRFKFDSRWCQFRWTI